MVRLFINVMCKSLELVGSYVANNLLDSWLNVVKNRVVCKGLWVIPKIMRQMCYKMAQKSYLSDTFQHHFF